MKWQLGIATLLQAAVATPAFAAPCKLPSGWSTLHADKARFIVFGEMHGTRESGETVESVACALARSGKRILIAVELSATSNDALQKAFEGPAANFAARLLATMPGWRGRNDGVASRAMLAMLDRLHQLKTEGYPIHVVAFNAVRDERQAARFRHLPSQAPHEAAQAENIRLAANARRYHQILVLVGNFHARKTKVDLDGVTFEPMAMRLASAREVLSLDMLAGPGSYWNCIVKPGFTLTPQTRVSSDAIDCGAHVSRLEGARKGPMRVGLRRTGDTDIDPDYDGFYWLPNVTASPPALPGAADGK